MESRAARSFYAPERERHDLRADRRDVSDYPSGGRRGYQAAKVAIAPFRLFLTKNEE